MIRPHARPLAEHLLAFVLLDEATRAARAYWCGMSGCRWHDVSCYRAGRNSHHRFKHWFD